MKSSLIPIIGIEVHVELKTGSKMFCSCPADHFSRPPNTAVCPVCLGLPGALPVPNKKAIEAVIALAGAFGGKINKNFFFDRKNYFYPDLPKGYQISQHLAPISLGGAVKIAGQNGQQSIALQDIHLEEDTAKLIHKNGSTLIDYNRSGVPLMEIVSQPKIYSSRQAKKYLKRIQQTVRWLGISDGDMEKGSMRLEANISLSKNKNILPGYRVEIKNLNSFRFAQKAIDDEIRRQSEIIAGGQKPSQETKGFDAKTGKTYLQRSKEEANDYRYFPEPDIPPCEFSASEIKKITKKKELLPWEEEKKLTAAFGINWENAQTMVNNKPMLAYFYKAAAIGGKKKINPAKIANLLINKKADWEKLSPEQMIKTILAAEQNRLGGKELVSIANKIVGDNPKARADYKQGKTQVIGFLIGQIQKATGGGAHPQEAKEALIKALDKT